MLKKNILICFVRQVEMILAIKENIAKFIICGFEVVSRQFNYRSSPLFSAKAAFRGLVLQPSGTLRQLTSASIPTAPARL